jgi:hypothetical protein
MPQQHFLFEGRVRQGVNRAAGGKPAVFCMSVSANILADGLGPHRMCAVRAARTYSD